MAKNQVYGTSTTYGSDDQHTLEVTAEWGNIYITPDEEDEELSGEYLALSPYQAKQLGAMLIAAAKAIETSRKKSLEVAA